MTSIKQNDSLISLSRLSSNDDYYNIVFKKTERVASAVFYVLSFVELNDRTRVHYTNLSDKAMCLHEAVIQSLTFYDYEVKDKIFSTQQALVALGSALTITVAARVITSDMTQSITIEIDTILRYIRNHYTHVESTTNRSSPTVSSVATTTHTRRSRPAIPRNDFSSDAHLVYSDLGDRTTRIRTVLEAKSEATIKDLSEIITDVSTKTIQRDLNSLIERGEVIRQGERRWSKYSISA